MWGLSSIKQIVAWRQRCVMSASVCSWEDVCFHNSQCFLSPKYLQSDALHCNIRKIQWKQRQTGIKRKSLFVFLSIFLLKEMTPTEKSQSPPGRKRLMVAGIQVHLEIYFSCFVVYISIPLNFRKTDVLFSVQRLSDIYCLIKVRFYIERMNMCPFFWLQVHFSHIRSSQRSLRR